MTTTVRRDDPRVSFLGFGGLTLLLAACTVSAEYAEKAAADGTSTATDTAPPIDTASPTDTAVPEYSEHPSLGSVQPCGDPQPHVRWQEQGQALGFPERPDDGRITGEATYLAVDDLDGDGDLDVVTSLFGHTEGDQPPAPMTVHHWVDGAFEITEIEDYEIAWAPTLIDIDEDGDQDILTPGSLDWVRNDGGSFRQVPWDGFDTERLPFIREFETVDLNGDGHIDLFGLSSHHDQDPILGSDILLWGNSDGTFSEAVDVIPPLEIPGTGFDSFWIDWFGDGVPEVFVANDRGSEHAPNALLQWDGSRFEDIAPRLRIDLGHDAMGADAADLNRDGSPDLYISATNRNVLMLSQPDGTLADVATALNADPVLNNPSALPMGWAGLFVDHDNDGELDLFTTQGDWWDVPGEREPSPIQLLRFDGSRFEDASDETGLSGTGSFRGAIAEDFNNDGVLDFLVSSLFGHHRLFMSEGCTRNNWLTVTAPNSARVQVTAGETVWTDWAMSSSSFGAHTRPRVHFGLGETPVIDRIEVVLPGGEAYTIEGPIEPRRHVQIPPEASSAL